MDPTRRFWQTVLAAALLAGGAVLFQRPLLLVGAALTGAFALATQLDAVRSFRYTDTDLTITQTVAPRRVPVEESAHVTLTVERARASPTTPALTARVSPPAGIRIHDPEQTTVELAPGETRATTTIAVDSPVAGRHTFGPPTVTLTDAHGWFRETFTAGPAVTLATAPRAPRNVHVGQGGEQLATGFGEHESEQLGSGLEPAELRTYEPGDAASRIDWKATARLDEPYVREFETETDRTVALVADHRAPMRGGPAGETKLAYAREVALAVLARASEANDPVALYTVGDAGVTTAMQPGATADHYERLREQLAAVEATDRQTRQTVMTRSPRDAARSATRLAAADTQFERTVAPFFQTSERYVERIRDDPLFGTIQSRIRSASGTIWTMIFTDDTNRTEVLEAATLATQDGNHAMVFLTPTVLFETDALADLDTAYDRYRDFESFRQRLDRLRRVSAFEVGPGDRIAAILDDRAERRERA